MGTVFPPSGLLLVNKPTGVSSHKALSPIKGNFRERRVGHAGTLDLFATGLLVVLVGKLTKLVPLLVGEDKEYRVTMRFGRETSTLDPHGSFVGSPGPIPSLRQVEEALAGLLGEMDQLPPDYSALHVGGTRAWRLALKGEKPAFSPRKVTIYHSEILRYDPPDLKFMIRCSKGTYVRAFARDLAEKCGTKGYLTALKRTKVGAFLLSEAREPQECLPEHLIAPSVFWDSHLRARSVRLTETAAVSQVRRGGDLSKILQKEIESLPYGIFDGEDRLLAVVQRKETGTGWRYLFVV